MQRAHQTRGNVVTQAEDIISVLRPMVEVTDEPVGEDPETLSSETAEPGSEERARIVSLLGPTPVLIDEIIRLSRSPPAVVRTAVLELELAGRIERYGAA
jgi:DNA processing protein